MTDLISQLMNIAYLPCVTFWYSLFLTPWLLILANFSLTFSLTLTLTLSLSLPLSLALSLCVCHSVSLSLCVCLSPTYLLSLSLSLSLSLILLCLFVSLSQDIGGPDEGMSMKQQGDLIFEILDKKPAFWAAPISLFDAIIGGLAFFGKWFDGAEDAAELARIGKHFRYACI